MSPSTVFCPDCGAVNDEAHPACHQCGASLHAHAAPPDPGPRPFHPRTFAIAAAVAVLIIVVVNATGLGFSLAVLPADDSSAQIQQRLDGLVTADRFPRADAQRVGSRLAGEAALRRQLEAGTLSPDDAESVRSRLRPVDQSVVLGFGGLAGLGWVLGAAWLAAIVATTLGRARRVREIVGAVAIASTVQALWWLVVTEFSLKAIASGELWMMGGGFSFAGAPFMLLGVTTVLSVGGAAALSAVLARGLEVATATATCVHCDHRIRLQPHAPEACPKYGRAQPKRGGLRYHGGDDFLAELGPSQVAASGDSAATLRCLRCAATTTREHCPTHPAEPLVDPTRDDVRFRLLELDTQAGTQRFAEWTGSGLGIDAARPPQVSDGPRLCTPCAEIVEGETCPRHPQEPLLDPTREDVRLELAAADDRARGRMGTGLLLAAAALSGLLSYGLGVATEFKGGIVIGGFAAMLTGFAIVARLMTPKLAPPRYTRWTGEGSVDLDEFGMGAQAKIFAPIRRAIAEARKRARTLGLIAAATTAVGATVGIALDIWPVGLGMAGGFIGLLTTLTVWSVRAKARKLAEAVSSARDAWHNPYA